MGKVIDMEEYRLQQLQISQFDCELLAYIEWVLTSDPLIETCNVQAIAADGKSS